MIDYNKLNYDDQDATIDLFKEVELTEEDPEVTIPVSFLLRLLRRLGDLHAFKPSYLAAADIPETKAYILEAYERLREKQNI
jgi:hypothetical protein